MNRHLGRQTRGTGFWIHSLVEPLRASGQVELGIATATAGDPACRFAEDGIDYFNIPQHKILEVFGVVRRARLAGYLRQMGKLIESWKPDLIHVHGTERFFGLARARGVTRVPTVVSIQGLIQQIQHWVRGDTSWWEATVNTTLWDLSRNATLPMDALRYRRQARIEREILMGIDAVIGRTDWDRANVREIKPGLPYYHVDEMIRPEFWSAGPWSPPGAARGTIFYASSAGLLKGLPVMLRALATLRRWGHDARLKVAGLSREKDRRGTAKYIFKLISSLELDPFVDLLGWLPADQLAARMLESSCYVSASFIENSSNAICEAQILGMPCIASHTGGTPSLVSDEQTGLLFSRGDHIMLARQVERVLLDDALSNRLGPASRDAARRRHDPQTIVAALLSAYRATVTKELR